MIIDRAWPGAALLIGLWINSVPISHAQTTYLSQQHVEAVANHLLRAMDTTAQAERNTRFVGVQMTTCPVTVSDQEGIYLYQEQALTENLEAPYRQRFLHIVLNTDATRIESHTFKPPTPELWTGLCQQANPSADISELGPLVCIVSLRPSPLGYVGSTPDEGCPVNLRGAVRLTNTIVLHQDGMDTWDRGFDATGVQVWGAQTEPYQYRWLQPDENHRSPLINIYSDGQ